MAKNLFSAAALLLLGGLLLWLLIIKSFAAYYSDVSPETALSLNPNEQTALVDLAYKKYSAAVRADGKNEIRNKAPSVEKQNSFQPNTNDRMETWAKMAVSLTKPKTLNGDDSTSNKQEDLQLQSKDTNLSPSLNLDLMQTEQVKEAQKIAVKVALISPLDPDALQLLGIIADKSNKQEEAKALMTASMRRSPRANAAIFWLLQKSLEKEDIERSAYLFDLILRATSSGRSKALPAFVKFAEDPKAKSEVKKLLLSNPPWRPQFLSVLPQYITDARTPLELLLSFQNSPNPPQQEEINSYLNFLISKNFPELAYYAWLQFLKTDELERTGLLYNGSFEFPTHGSPFDWTIHSGNGVTMEIAPNPEDAKEKVLFIEFNQGRVDFNPVSQMLVLNEGPYHLTGRYKGKILGKRGLLWRMSCLKEGKLLAETPMLTGITKNWTELSLDFEIPEKDCTVQSLRLELDARSSSEKLVSGSVWYDDLMITRAAPKVSSTEELSSEKTTKTTGSTETAVSTEAVEPTGARETSKTSPTVPAKSLESFKDPESLGLQPPKTEESSQTSLPSSSPPIKTPESSKVPIPATTTSPKTQEASKASVSAPSAPTKNKESTKSPAPMSSAPIKNQEASKDPVSLTPQPPKTQKTTKAPRPTTSVPAKTLEPSKIPSTAPSAPTPTKNVESTKAPAPASSAPQIEVQESSEVEVPSVAP